MPFIEVGLKELRASRNRDRSLFSRVPSTTQTMFRWNASRAAISCVGRCECWNSITKPFSVITSAICFSPASSRRITSCHPEGNWSFQARCHGVSDSHHGSQFLLPRCAQFGTFASRTLRSSVASSPAGAVSFYLRREVRPSSVIMRLAKMPGTAFSQSTQQKYLNRWFSQVCGSSQPAASRCHGQAIRTRRRSAPTMFS